MLRQLSCEELPLLSLNGVLPSRVLRNTVGGEDCSDVIHLVGSVFVFGQMRLSLELSP